MAMKNLTLSISTANDEGPVVSLSARFASAEEAIAFHARVADLCREAAGKELVQHAGYQSMSRWPLLRFARS
jgi:hypothetical protein